ncbi:hypothetical protein CI266_004645 [Salmonella enterica subsp. enterica serovar Kotte]|nr:hypothetical protein [Salmonella enterica subsp. enterica serovar Kotte]
MLEIKNLKIYTMPETYIHQVTCTPRVQDEDDIVSHFFPSLLHLLYPNGNDIGQACTVSRWSSNYWEWYIGKSLRDINSSYGYIIAKGKTKVEIIDSKDVFYSADIVFTTEDALQREWAGFRLQPEHINKKMRMIVHNNKPSEWSILE